MRLPRPRFTVRGMMTTLAFVSIPLAYGERWVRYKKIASYHGDMYWGAVSGGKPVIIFAGPGDPVSLFHARKFEEYERAAPYPWISVKLESPPSLDSTPAELPGPGPP